MRRRLGLAGAMLVAALAGAGNVERAACWTQTDGWVCGPLARSATTAAATPVSGFAKIEVIAPAWRPLRIRLRARGLASDAGLRVAESATLTSAIDVPANGQDAMLTTSAPEVAPNRIALWADASAPASIAIVAVEPAWSPLAAAVAFAAGFAAVLLLAWGLRGHTSVPAAATRTRRLTASDLGMALAVLGVYAAWAILKPPMQSPDEPQHHVRATSIPATPFVGGAWQVTVAPAHRNPLTWTPNPLHWIINKPAQRLSAAEVADVRAMPWRPASAYPAVEYLPSAVASYPPTYYWTELLGGEALTAAMGLSPWGSIVAYRVVSAILAWAIWLVVLALLRDADATRDWALPAWLILAATPTVASIGASVNPDALVIPATVLAMVAAWRVLATGSGVGLLTASAALAAAIKPSGLLALAAMAAGAAAWGYARAADRDRAWLVIRRLAAVGAGAWLAYYAWSTPRLSPVPGSPSLSIPAYAVSLWHRLPMLWVELWGRLGWQEYAASGWWYWTLFAAVLGLAALAVRRRLVDADLARYAVVASGAYVALVIGGELVQHPQAGLMLQGRYFAPAALPLALLAGQDRVTRWTLPALLAGLHVALAVATVDRYFGGDWALWWRAVSGGP